MMMSERSTGVTHSCVGNFTSPHQQNLIVVKCSRIEIHGITAQGCLEDILDLQTYGGIATIELFRHQGENQDSLFIFTKGLKYCVLHWDAESSKLVTRISSGTPLYRFDRIPKIPFVYQELQVLDIKFLYGCSKPTIVVLYQDNKGVRHVKTYEVLLKEKDFAEGPWSQNNLDKGAGFIIPVRMPLGGVIIIGEETIAYRSASVFKTIPTRSSFTRAYGRVDADGSRYLLSDHEGLLHFVVITHEKQRVTGLKIELVGETYIASTMSYLDNAIVYIGSRFGDSQLVKLNLHPDAKGYVEVVQRFVNLGPIVDFYVVDLERQGQGQVVTCSGAYKDGSLRVVENGISISEQALIELRGVKGIWSFRTSPDDPCDTVLVVSFINETRILAMNSADELEKAEIEGFDSEVQTLFCHDAVNNQLVQVTASSVRLVGSTSHALLAEWKAPVGLSINVATANSSQVLLATEGGHLVYLEIDDGKLTEAKHVVLEYEVSCLDINPIGENPNFSQLAAVGMWTDMSVQIFSLPGLDLIRKEQLGAEIIACSVLLCAFEGVPYLLCALGDGHLFNYLLNVNTGELTDRTKVSLGTQPITLHTFFSGHTTHVFAASDRPAVIYSSNKNLLYSSVNLKEVSYMCPFNTARYPDSLAIAKEGELTIGTIHDIQKLRICKTPLGEHAKRICHQEKFRTLAICTMKFCQSNSKDSEVHFVRLLDDQTSDIISTYRLDTYEYACCVLSCSFSDDSNVYYCVGTAYALPKESGPSKGRVHVFVVEDGKLLLLMEKETDGLIYSLNSPNQKRWLQRWLRDNRGLAELACLRAQKDGSLGVVPNGIGNDKQVSHSVLLF
ncbi:hypothetical protein MKW94_022080 [Papaver nudicaule]|uniref:DNA damage-binding protein 1 n=1 Tax=Papaver nudicaule TaxID=74823 RepID=A0AA41S8I5_PAPNU|nr:hypothetical protein [Papaver nudicaule]